MSKYQFAIPKTRGQAAFKEQTIPAALPSAQDVILHMLLARIASSDGNTTELRTVFDPVARALNLDVPQDILDAIEDISIGDNLRRFLDWLTHSNEFNNIQFTTGLLPPSHSEGLVFYDDENKALAVYNNVADITLQVGQEQWLRAHNTTGSTITNGQVVRITGAAGDGHPVIDLAKANTQGGSFAVGVATHDIPNDTDGFVTTFGVVRDIDTSGFVSGDQVWVSPFAAGDMVNTRPVQPNFSYSVGWVLTADANGSMFVKPEADDYYTKSQVDNIINNIDIGGVSIPNQLTVALTGGTGDLYPSIEDAIDQINSYAGGPQEATVNNPYVIRVTAGSYVENPLVVPSWVTIRGDAQFSCLVTASDNNSPLFTLSDSCSVENLTTVGPTNDAAVLSQSVNTSARLMVASGCLTAIQVDGVGKDLLARDCSIFPGVTTGLLATNSGALDCSNILSYATTHVYANGGSIWIHNSGGLGGTNGLYANNGGLIESRLITFKDTTNVVRVNNNSTINGLGVASHGTSTWDILQEDASDIALSACEFLQTKISMTSAATAFLDFSSILEDDEGHEFYKELHVGSPEQGRESVLGEGDSYTRGMLVYTETPGNVFVDVSIAARSASGSTFTFPGVAQDNAIYVSSDLQDATDYKQFLGIKMKNTTAAVLGGGAIVAEYWNGASWVVINTLATNGDSPYTSYANVLFVRTNASEQIRFEDTRSAWQKNDPPTTGTNRYWIRFRISSGITTAPVFEQFKIHSNRTEINADGFVEYFGVARALRKIANIHLRNTFSLVGAAPTDENITYGAIINLAGTENEFANGTTDGFGQTVAIPPGLDTSLPLTFIVRWAPTTNVASGDVVLDLTYGLAQVGTILNGANSETNATPNLTATILNSQDRVYESRITIKIPSALEGDTLLLALRRQAAGGTGPTGDTYAGNIYIVSTNLTGYFWH